MLAALFEMKGYRVSVAADGAQALWTISKEPFDLVLSDVRMPKGTSRAILRT